MAEKFYQVHYATSASGPWTLVNDSPIAHLDLGNQYTISGLAYNTPYFVRVVGGVMDDQDFIPRVHQHVGPQLLEAGGVEEDISPAYQVKTWTPIVVANTGLGHTVEVI